MRLSLIAAFLLAVLFLFQSGCTGEQWIARLYMFQAENAFDKAHKLRVQKIPYESRLRYYRIACDRFWQAYRFDPEVFTLYRIGLAVEACLRVENKEAEMVFRDFEERYAAEHPVEVEFGDAFPLAIE